jgi:hypothetical protein
MTLHCRRRSDGLLVAITGENFDDIRSKANKLDNTVCPLESPIRYYDLSAFMGDTTVYGGGEAQQIES